MSTEEWNIYNQSFIESLVDKLRGGKSCCVFGPPNQGKSKLVRQALNLLDEYKNEMLYLSFQDRAGFLDQSILYDEIIRQMDVQFPSSSSVRTFTRRLETIAQNTQHFLLIVDDLETLPQDMTNELLMLLTDIRSKLASKCVFQLLTCSSAPFDTDLTGFRRVIQSAEILLITPPTLEEIAVTVIEMSACHGYAVTHEALEWIIKHTEGDIFLVQQLLENTDVPLQLDVAGLEQAVKRLIASKKTRVLIFDQLSMIEDRPELLEYTLRLLDGKLPAQLELPKESRFMPDRLQLCGVFKREGEGYTIRSALWWEILKHVWTVERIGSIYSITGAWDRATKYFNRVLRENRDPLQYQAVVAQVEIVILGAIRSSESFSEAVSLLCQGLEVIFPDCNIIFFLYRAEGEYYDPIYPGEPVRSIAHLMQPLYLEQRPSLSTLTYFPLCASTPADERGIVDDIFGYLYIGRNSHQLTNAQLAREQTALKRFLNAAARALHTLLYVDELRSVELKLQILQEVFVLPILQQRYSGVIYRLMLAGVTCRWGLGFNRAILFLLSKDGKNLNVAYAVGHLEWRDADKDWHNFRFDTPQELVQDILANPNQPPTPLYDAIRNVSIRRSEAKILEADAQNQPSQRYSDSRLLPVVLQDLLQPRHDYVVTQIYHHNQRLGVLYADNQFTGGPIPLYLRKLLDLFTRQVAFVLHKVESTQLQEFQVAPPLLRKLDLVALSLNRLLNGYCTVIHSLGSNDGRRSYWSHNVVSYPPEFAGRTSRKRYAGLIPWIIEAEDGIRMVDDISSHPPIPDAHAREGRAQLSQSEFVRRNQIASFAGVRLGTSDNPVGVLIVNWRESRRLQEYEQHLLKGFADLATSEIRSSSQVEVDKLVEHLTNRATATLDEQIVESLSQGYRQLHIMPRVLLRQPGEMWEEYWLEQPDQLNPVPRRRDYQITSALRALVNLFTRSQEQEEYVQQLGKNNFILAAPILLETNCAGVLYINVDPDKETRNNQVKQYGRILMGLAQQFALQLRLFDTNTVLVKLRQLSTYSWEGLTDLKLITNEIVRHISETFRLVDAITLYYYDDSTRSFRIGSHVGLREPEALDHFPPYEDHVIDFLQESCEPVIGDPELVENELSRTEDFLVTAFYPVSSNQKHDDSQDRCDNIGLLYINYRYNHRFGEEDRQLLSLFQQTAAVLMNRAIQQRRAERKSKHLDVANKIARAILNLDPIRVTETILSSIREEFGKDIAHNLAIVKLENNHLIIDQSSLRFYKVSSHVPPNEDYRVKLVEGKRSLAALAIEQDQWQIENHITESTPDYFKAISSTRAEIAVPIGGMDAAIVVESDYHDVFNYDHLELLDAIVEYVGAAIRRANSYETERARDELEQRLALAKWSSLSYHELASPVSKVGNEVARLKEGLPPELLRQLKPRFQRIEKNLRKTNSHFSKLRDLDQLGRFEPRPTPLRDIIQLGYNEAKHRTRFKSIRFNFNSEDEIFDTVVYVDTYWLALVVKNLIQNAYNAIKDQRRKSKPQSMKGVITIRAERKPRRVHIFIEDNGRGIRKEDWEEIFEPGYTTQFHRGPEHGLGLHLSRLVVVGHHGILKVERSTPGEGTIIKLSLPVKEG